MKKSQLCSFVLVVALASCNKRISEASIPTIQVDLTANTELLNSDSILWPDSVTVIPLQSDKSTPIGSVEIFKSDGQKIIVVDSERRSVFIFNTDGSFYNKIEAVGRANNEYFEISDVCINENSLYILDYRKGVILEYTMSGKFVKRISIDKYWANKIEYLNGLIYLINDYSDSESGKYELFVIDENGELKNKYLPFEGEYTCTPTVPSVQNLDEVMIVEHLNNTIYTVSENGCKPLVRLDFGNKQLPSQYLSLDLRELMMKGLRQQYVTGIKTINFSKNLIFIGFDYGLDQYTLIYDRITRKSTMTRGIVVKSNFKTGLNHYFVCGDNIYEIVDASTLLFTYENVFKGNDLISSPYKEKMEELIENTLPSDNPILFKYKMK